MLSHAFTAGACRWGKVGAELCTRFGGHSGCSADRVAARRAAGLAARSGYFATDSCIQPWDTIRANLDAATEKLGELPRAHERAGYQRAVSSESLASSYISARSALIHLVALRMCV